MEAKMEKQTTKKLRGFATLDPEQRRAMAQRGGKAAHARGKAHRWDRETARAAGLKAAAASPKTTAQMQTLGRRGGLKVSASREHMAKIGQRGGLATKARKG
ncbi:hypothetical protein WME86_16875 [Sorangium sp. So ce1024]